MGSCHSNCQRSADWKSAIGYARGTRFGPAGLCCRKSLACASQPAGSPRYVGGIFARMGELRTLHGKGAKGGGEKDSGRKMLGRKMGPVDKIINTNVRPRSVR